MCLNTVTETYDPPREMIFYKLVKHRAPRLSDPEYLHTQPADRYKNGFHGWTNKKSIPKYLGWATIQCKGLVHTVGEEPKGRTVVAKTLEIIKEVQR